MNTNTKNTINKKADGWFNKFCKGKATNKTTIEEKAAFLSYKPSVQRAIKFNKNNLNKQSARDAAEKVLIKFLQKKDFSNETIFNLWDEIWGIYHEQGITQYTYGNAQKWVGMAVKYYLILESKIKRFDVTDKKSSAWDFDLLPIDGIILKYIKKNYGIFLQDNKSKKVYSSWSKCDNKQAFIDCLDSVSKAIQQNYDKSIFYEISKW